MDDNEEVYSNGCVFEFGFWRGSHGERLSKPLQEFLEDDAVWPVELQNPDCYERKSKIGGVSSGSHEEMISGDTGRMKDLDLAREDVRDVMIRCYKWWISQSDCDGFRIDTFKHCEPSATSIFVNAIKEYTMSIGKSNFFVFAEIVDDDPALMRYLASNVTRASDDQMQEYPRLTTCLDFPLYYMLEDVLKGRAEPLRVIERYRRFQHYFRDYGNSGSYFLTIIDNHHQIGRSCFRFLHGDPDARIVKLGIGYLLTSMGIPCIYYGTEQCFEGGMQARDEYVRETMFGGPSGAFGATEGHFFNRQHETYQAISKLSEIRVAEPTLRHGRQYFLQTSKDFQTFDDPREHGEVFAYSRVLDATSL